MNGSPLIYNTLQALGIEFDYYEHPAAPTIAEAMKYWKDIEATHCKNLFFRNHKGNRHYLVVIEHTRDLAVRDLELRLKQGKLTFSSPERMMRYLGVTPGSVSPLGIVNDKEHHVYLFIDKNLCSSGRISFHPGINTASIVIAWNDFIRFLDHAGNGYEFLELY